MKYSVYVIKDKYGKLYKGMTSNLERRLQCHDIGAGGWTKNRGPFELIYFESGYNKTNALER